MIARLASSIALLTILGGCALAPLPPLTSAHPASPAAAEAPLPQAPATLDPETDPDRDVPATSSHHAH